MQVRLLVVLLVGLFGCVFGALGQPVEKPLQIADCIALIRPDSVHLFFDSNLALTPQACAYFRRECRMDAANGNFVGLVCDYRQFTNKLIRKVHYINGQRNGAYEEYYANQQLSVRGQFADGNPSGTWQFWYEDGKPHQTLQWTGHARPSLLVMDFWDPAGQQQVTNGEGNWRAQTEGVFPMWFGGPIVHGYQQGEWESHDARSNEVLTIEEFDKGRLKQGQQLVAKSLSLVGQRQAAQTMKYTTRPSLEVKVADASQKLEPLHLGQNCEQQVRAREAASAIMDAMVDNSGKSDIQLPMPRPTPSAYQRALLQQVNSNPALKQWLPQHQGSKTTITADVDERGQLHNIAAVTKELTDAIAIILNGLGDWKPAVVKGKPMPGQIEIVLRCQDGQLQSMLTTNLATSMMPGAYFNSK
jgi:hypothetical protein